MRLIGLLAAALSLTQILPAHGKYNARRDEVAEQIKTIAPADLQKIVSEGISKELEQRNDSLEKSQDEILKKEYKDPLQEKWVKHHQDAAQNRKSNFDSVISKARNYVDKNNLAPADGKDHPAVALLAQTKAGQFNLHNAVKSMPLAQLRDNIGAWRGLYTEWRDNLQKEFHRIVHIDSTVDRDAKNLRDRLLSVCTDFKRDLQEQRTLLKNANLAPDRDASYAKTWANSYKYYVDETVEVLHTFSSRARVGDTGLRAAQDREHTFLQTLVTRRQEVKTFVEDHSYQEAKSNFDTKLAEAKKIAETGSTDGNKKDLAGFVADANTILAKNLKGFEDATKGFTAWFKGKLLKPYSDTNNEKFVEMSEWKKWADQIKNCDANGIIKDMMSENRNNFGVERMLDAIQDEEAREIARDAVEAGERSISSALSTAAPAGITLENWTELRRRREILDWLNGN